MALRDQPNHLGGVGFFEKLPGITDRNGFFAISGARQNPRNIQQENGLRRCDSNAYGPYGFHRWSEINQVCSCGSEDMPEPAMGHHLITLENLATVMVVIEAYPYGYVLYFELNNEEDEETCIKMAHSDCARTLQELFRLMVEWEFAHKELGSGELTATTCSGMLEVLQMPQSVRNYLLQQVPNEKVARFLSGNTNAQDRNPVETIPLLSEEFDLWLENKIIHSSPLGTRR